MKFACLLRVRFAAVLAVLLVSSAAAQEPKPGPLDRKSLDERVAKVLRVVYHEGAVELYNRSRQAEAAYYFQGALTTIEPFLDHHPELQRAVVKGLADAKKITNLDDRAWRLRDVLVTIQRTVEPEPNPDSLWARLGGEKKVKKIVSDWVDACIDDPKVNFSRNGKYKLTAKQTAELKERFVDLASAVTGGPREYSGKTMKVAHKGLGITDAEFTLAVSKLKIALLRNDAALKDVERILGAVASTRGDIVEAAGPGDVGEPTGTLWERLGGEEKVKKIMSDYVDAALADPKVNYTRNGKYKMSAERIAGLKSQLVDLASSLGGGPRKYQGKTMKEIHTGLGITEGEFDALLAVAKRTLIRHEVADADREKILAAFESKRADIVEVKAEAPRKAPDRAASLPAPLRKPEAIVPVAAPARRGEK